MKTLVECIFGSHLYGLNTPSSDFDFKKIVLPPLRSVLLEGPKYVKTHNTKVGEGKNTADDVDIEVFALKNFFDLAMKGEMIAIDMLHSNPEHWVVKTPSWEYIWRNRDMFYSKNMRAYIGYIRRQVAKYNFKGSRLNALTRVIDVIHALKKNYDPDETRIETILEYLPTDGEFLIKREVDGPNNTRVMGYEVLGSVYMLRSWMSELDISLKKKLEAYGDRAKKAADNEGVDYKAVSHAYRALLQINQLIDTGTIKFPFVGAERDKILAIKTGAIPYSDIQDFLEEEYEKTISRLASCDLPDNPDRSRITEVLLNIYKNEYGLKHEDIFDG